MRTRYHSSFGLVMQCQAHGFSLGRLAARCFGSGVSPTSLHVYRALALGVAPFLVWCERLRHKLSAEELKHRCGDVSELVSLEKPGTVLWLHGASIGETTGALAVARSLGPVPPAPITGMLFTASSPSAVRLLTLRLRTLQRDLPGITLACQLVPIDSPRATRRFMRGLRPVAGIFIESDVWPNLLHEAAAQGVPLSLLDARISSRSARAWNRHVPALGRSTFSKFSAVYAQSKQDASRLQGLGARISGLMPSLKFASKVDSPSNSPLSRALKESVADRPTWIAASTHLGEEEIMFMAHKRVTSLHNLQDALLILVPRHPSRILEILEGASRIGAFPSNQITLRSSSPDIVPKSTSIYVVDSVGELQHFYEIARLAFVGNSLLPGGRGHNFAEPANARLPVLMGPYIGQYRFMMKAVDDEMRRSNGLIPNYALQQVTSPSLLAQAVVDALTDNEKTQALGRAFRQAVGTLGDTATHHCRKAVLNLISERR
jgi:3-deoxy-D-manno-octulosonic-acid transferase